MNGTNDLGTDGSDNDLFEGWFEQGELTADLETADHQEMSHHRSRVGMIIAAVSATALILVMVLAGAVWG